MNFDRISRKQTVVLWEAAGFTGSGDIKVSAPVEVEHVRFEEGRRQSVSDQGSPIAYDASLFTERVIAAGGIVWEGTLEALSAQLNDDPSPLYEVIGVERSPGTKNRSTNRAVTLQRFKGVLPTVV